jgi:DNA-binding PadR family transcriptional regulator
MKHFVNHYPTTLAYIMRLENMGLLFVSKEEQWRLGKTKKWYLTSSKGRSVLRGHEEAERRE